MADQWWVWSDFQNIGFLFLRIKNNLLNIGTKLALTVLCSQKEGELD